MTGPIIRSLRSHDPGWYALHKAIKVAVIVTLGLAVGTLVIGNAQVSTFAAFGGVALLLFADFPGSRSARLGSYIGLGLAGSVLIVLGTLVSPISWLAVLGMATVGFVVLFSGVLSAALAGASRAALLTFILPVTMVGTVGDIPFRLAGWGVALALAIPAAILVWSPRDHDKLRSAAARACSALAGQISERSSGAPTSTPRSATTTDGAPSDSDRATREAIDALRTEFRSTSCRPVGLTTGSRLLMRLTDLLEWLRSVIDQLPAGGSNRWPVAARDQAEASAETLRACADVLAAAAQRRPTFATRQHLATAMRQLDHHRAQAGLFAALVANGSPNTDAGTGAEATDDVRPSLIHELAYTAHLAGDAVAVSAAADARPLIDRLLGRGVPGGNSGAVAAAHRIVAGHITQRSVWFQNSIRGALGLSIAVLIAELTEVSHGFWVVLGAMSVLRTTALTTGSTALRALAGTTIGFVAGAGIILLIGTTPWHLWLLLPLSIAVAAYLPEVVSFAAGQAAFTLMVVIMFNIIQPVGWTVGLLRIEDIALGCAAGLIAGILLWPRGAAARIAAALAENYRSSARVLQVATDHVVSPTIDNPIGAAVGVALQRAKAASDRLDDAFREYLFERGSKSVPLTALTSASNGANRLRLAAETIATMSRIPVRSPAPVAAPTTGPTAGPTQVPPIAASEAALLADAVQSAAIGLSRAATETAGWFDRIAGALERSDSQIPNTTPATAEEHVLQTFHRTPAAVTGHAADHARRLWAISLYVDDASRMEGRLIPSITTLVASGRPGQRSRTENAATADADQTPAETTA